MEDARNQSLVNILCSTDRKCIPNIIVVKNVVVNSKVATVTNTKVVSTAQRTTTSCCETPVLRVTNQFSDVRSPRWDECGILNILSVSLATNLFRVPTFTTTMDDLTVRRITRNNLDRRVPNVVGQWFTMPFTFSTKCFTPNISCARDATNLSRRDPLTNGKANLCAWDVSRNCPVKLGNELKRNAMQKRNWPRSVKKKLKGNKEYQLFTPPFLYFIDVNSNTSLSQKGHFVPAGPRRKFSLHFFLERLENSKVQFAFFFFVCGSERLGSFSCLERKHGR